MRYFYYSKIGQPVATSAVPLTSQKRVVVTTPTGDVMLVPEGSVLAAPQRGGAAGDLGAANKPFYQDRLGPSPDGPIRVPTAPPKLPDPPVGEDPIGIKAEEPSLAIQLGTLALLTSPFWLALFLTRDKWARKVFR